MGYDDRREIFERLESIERRLGSRRDDRDRGGYHGDRRRDRGPRHDGRRRGDGDFEEKRIIDTIVRLVSEHVECIVEDKLERMRPQGDEGGEKRIVDLIVRLVSEHVQEIVATELDRRLGPPNGRPEPGEAERE